MKLYLSRGLKSGMMGTVFHLDEECAKLPDNMVYDIASVESMRHFRDTFGIRRICLKCRKDVSKDKKDSRGR